MNYKDYIMKIRELSKEDQEKLATIGLIYMTKTLKTISQLLEDTIRKEQNE